MFTAMADQFPPTTPGAIESFESARGIHLPAAYREFFLEYNGGRPRERLFPVLGVLPPAEFAIHFFYGLDAPIQSYDLAHKYDFFNASIPSGIVPVAASARACSYYCLDLRHGNEAVCFWDQTHHWGTGEWREEDLYVICDTFDRFLSMLSA